MGEGNGKSRELDRFGRSDTYGKFTPLICTAMLNWFSSLLMIIACEKDIVERLRVDAITANFHVSCYFLSQKLMHL